MLRAVASLLVVLVVAGAALGLYEWHMDGHVYQGVRLGGVDVSGLLRAEALARLRAVGNISLAPPLVLLAAGREWLVSPLSLGNTVDLPASVNGAYRLGRTGNPLQSLGEQLQLLLAGRAVPLRALDEALPSIAACERVPKNKTRCTVPSCRMTPGLILASTMQPYVPVMWESRTTCRSRER